MGVHGGKISLEGELNAKLLGCSSISVARSKRELVRSEIA
jgi:hypothetical protein